jgi:hypothetical protein
MHRPRDCEPIIGTRQHPGHRERLVVVDSDEQASTGEEFPKNAAERKDCCARAIDLEVWRWHDENACIVKRILRDRRLAELRGRITNGLWREVLLAECHLAADRAQYAARRDRTVEFRANDRFAARDHQVDGVLGVDLRAA